MTKDFVKQLRIKSNAIKTCPFGNGMSLTCFSIQFTQCILILSPLPSLTFYQPSSPPSLKRFCDTRISSRHIINSGEIHFAAKMIQWAKIMSNYRWLLFPLFPVLIFFGFFIKLKGLHCTELLDRLFPPSGTVIILLL